MVARGWTGRAWRWRLLVAAVAGVGAAVGLVLGLAARPVLELLGRVALLELAPSPSLPLRPLPLRSGPWSRLASSSVMPGVYPRPETRNGRAVQAARPFQSESLRSSSVSGPEAQSVRPPGRAPRVAPHREADHRTSVQGPAPATESQDSAETSGSRIAFVSGARGTGARP